MLHPAGVKTGVAVEVVAVLEVEQEHFSADLSG